MLSTLGLTGTKPIDINGEMIAPKDIGVALLGNLPMPEELPPPVSAIKVWVRGKRGDEAVQYVYTFFGRMTDWTGVPASIGTQMVGRGAIKTKGVLAPEGCVDTNAFLAEIAKRGMEIEEVEERCRVLKG